MSRLGDERGSALMVNGTVVEPVENVSWASSTMAPGSWPPTSSLKDGAFDSEILGGCGVDAA